MTYKGMMCSDVPNLAFAIGYTNASWTLKCDLTCEYVCRLLNYMDAHGYDAVLPAPERPVGRRRSRSSTSRRATSSARIDQFPRQGSKAPWKLYQNYALDLRDAAARAGSTTATMEFSAPSHPAA